MRGSRTDVLRWLHKERKRYVHHVPHARAAGVLAGAGIGLLFVIVLGVVWRNCRDC